MRAALVEYYVLASEAVAFVVRPDEDAPIVVRLDVTREAIRTAAHRLIHDFSPDNINPVYPEWSSDWEFLDPLARGLLDRVWPHLRDIDLLCIVPHGYLFYLPFHALKLASGRYLVEECPVVYAPSAALALSARLQAGSRDGRRFVGFGTGKMDDAPARRDGFEQEILAVAGMPFWQEPRVLTGTAAASSGFLAAASDASVVHCACHGYFDASDPLASGLLLSDGMQAPEWAAGAGPHERFVLSARELAAGTLSADLVYLSACVSGRHDIRPGDEILGLVRGLISAGAASIVASLWPIAAWSSTRRLVETFYTRWLGDGMSRACAMQAAQLETAAHHPHPYHWAPFALVGDWR